MTTATIIDAMATIQMVKSGGSATFGDLAAKHYHQLTASLGKNRCQRVDIVFDRYIETSIKQGGVIEGAQLQR